MSRITAFDYPVHKHERLHGPDGYTDYASYREWLRDEFHFRCVFCLQREEWGRRMGSFHIDHLVPQAIEPQLGCEYDNLLYVCAQCNAVKSDELIAANPCEISFGHCLAVDDDGAIVGQNDIGRRLVMQLRLDDRETTAWRKKLLQGWRALIETGRTAEYAQFMRYPEELPDLRAKRPPNNSRPDGVLQCAFERRRRGELPDTY